MPMERLTPRPDFQEENRQARNAEEALLGVLNACARVTKTVSKIQWHTPESGFPACKGKESIFMLMCFA
jgi:hypothetical protein